MLLTSRLKPLPPPPQALSAWGGDTCHNLDKKYFKHCSPRDK